MPGFIFSQINGLIRLCNEPGRGVYVHLELTDSKGQVQKTGTDGQGFFRFGDSVADTFRITITSPYFFPLDSVFFSSEGQDVTIELCLTHLGLAVQSEELVVKDSRSTDEPQTYTQNEYKVLPGSFQDPSRVLLRSPGFTTDNDGANGIVFRGLPPEMHRWQMFGVDIVNPNHLPNAGTANDLSTSHAGGVNAFSGSVLGKYHFESNPASISYMDAGSGASSMSMADSLQPFIDVNLIGLEAGIGTSVGGRKMYASYRYSFVGLLEKLGVGFGNERIGYQDVAFYADILKSKTTKLRVFGLTGSSYNMHDPVNFSNAELTRFKDMQAINFGNNISIYGADYLVNIGRRGVFATSLAWSSRVATRSEESDSLWSVKTGIYRASQHLQGEKMLSIHSRYDYLSFTGLRIQSGFRMSASERNWQSHLVKADTLTTYTVYPYIQLAKEYTVLSIPFRGDGGLAIRTESNAGFRLGTEPFVQVETQLSSPSKVQFRYRLATMPHFVDPLSVSAPGKMGIKGQHFQLRYTYRGEGYSAGSNLFTHVFSKMPVYTLENQPASIFHLSNGASGGYDFISAPSKILASGTSPFVSYGCEIFGQVTTTSWRMEGNITILNASFKREGSPNRWLASKYSVGRIANLVLLYQRERKKGDQSRVWMAGAAIHYRGGYLRQQFAGLSNTDVVGIYRPESAYINALNDYVRVDFRFVYKRLSSNNRVVHRWSLDIQNLLNRQNDGYFYEDLLFKGVYLQKQLGFIPVISYRLEFPVLSIK